MNEKAIKGCTMLVLVLLISILGFHTSSSAKVYRGTFEKNMKWSFDTQSKTVTVVCKGRMDDCDDCDSGRSFGWQKAYAKAKKIVFRKGITYIGVNAFQGFIKVDKVILPEGLVSIGASAFQDTVKLKKLQFPSSLKIIGENCFDCSGITSVSLKNISHVGSEAFSGTNLKKLIVPSGCNDIKSYAFDFCSQLKCINFEKGVKCISEAMFLRSGMESVTIPSSVTKIGTDAFYAFSPVESKLKSVTIQSTKIKKWGKDIFGKARKDLVIKVPKCRLKEYTKALRKGGLPKYVKIVAE